MTNVQFPMSKEIPSPKDQRDDMCMSNRRLAIGELEIPWSLRPWTLRHWTLHPWSLRHGSFRFGSLRHWSLVIAAGSLLAVLPAAACPIRVFRYALARWPADNSRLEVSPADAKDEAIARFLRNFGTATPLN